MNPYLGACVGALFVFSFGVLTILVTGAQFVFVLRIRPNVPFCLVRVATNEPIKRRRHGTADSVN